MLNVALLCDLSFKLLHLRLPDIATPCHQGHFVPAEVELHLGHHCCTYVFATGIESFYLCQRLGNNNIYSKVGRILTYLTSSVTVEGAGTIVCRICCAHFAMLVCSQSISIRSLHSLQYD